MPEAIATCQSCIFTDIFETASKDYEEQGKVMSSLVAGVDETTRSSMIKDPQPFIDKINAERDGKRCDFTEKGICPVARLAITEAVRRPI